jgi:predicted RNA binding protein YcfA (HicA-like mRNA interferase family)
VVPENVLGGLGWRDVAGAASIGSSPSRGDGFEEDASADWQLIESDGWVLVRTKGSHRQFQHPTKPGTVTIAGNPGVEVPAGTLNSVLKQAGLKA